MLEVIVTGCICLTLVNPDLAIAKAGASEDGVL